MVIRKHKLNVSLPLSGAVMFKSAFPPGNFASEGDLVDFKGIKPRPFVDRIPYYPLLLPAGEFCKTADLLEQVPCSPGALNGHVRSGGIK
jgi:hypothetical protein